MKFRLTLCVLGLLVGAAVAQQVEVIPPKGKPGKPNAANRDKASYGLGLRIGRDISADDVELNLDMIIQGLRDGLSKKAAMFSDEELDVAIRAFQEEHMAKMNARLKVEAEKNQKVGAAFLAKNAKAEGVKTTASGLQYKVVKAGMGATPKATDMVKTHYRGTLIDGTEFDSSYKRKEPVVFPVNGVIKGWTEALQMMKVGDKWQLYIPAELAYGMSPPNGSRIPPNATLVFDVELLDIPKKK